MFKQIRTQLYCHYPCVCQAGAVLATLIGLIGGLHHWVDMISWFNHVKTGPPWAFIKGWWVADVAVFWAWRFWLATEKITTGAVQILQRPMRWFIANQHALITNRTSTQLDMFSPDLLITLERTLPISFTNWSCWRTVVMPWGVPKATFESTRVSKTCVELTRAASQFEMIWRKRSGSDSLNPICWVQLCWTLKWHLETRSNSDLGKLGTLIFTPP